MRRVALITLLVLTGTFASSAHAAGPGSVEGTVSPINWATEVEVCLLEAGPLEHCTVPAANGTYALRNLPLGSVQIAFIPSFRSRLAPQYYDQKERASEAISITLTEKSPTAQGVDGNLVESGSILGTVSAAGGSTGLAGVEVCAVSVSPPQARSCSETDSGGEYELHSLPTGLYRVGFWPHESTAAYESQYYDEATLAQSTMVRAIDGVPTEGIDAALVRGGRIEGVISSAATGAPLANASVCLFEASKTAPERCTYSDEVGGYAFQGLADGTYQVGFSLSPAELVSEVSSVEEDGFQAQYYADAPTRAAARGIPLVAPTIVSGVDASLVPVTAALPAPPAPAISAPATPAAPFIAEPQPKRTGCKKGYARKKVKGKPRCVKVVKKKAKKRKKKSSHQKRHHRRPAQKHRPAGTR